jgi:lipase chaperone LimK
MKEMEPNNRDRGERPDEEDELKPLFELGQIVGTPGALQELQQAEQNPLELIVRHVTGDWGDLCEEDMQENEFALERGLRIFSSYELKSGDKIWVITEHDRSVTTILRPEDY